MRVDNNKSREHVSVATILTIIVAILFFALGCAVTVGMFGGLNKRYYGYGYCTTIDDNDSKSLCIAQVFSDCKIADMFAILECTMCFGV